MTTLRAAAQQALEALEISTRFVYADNRPQCEVAIDSLRTALAEEALQVMADNASGLGLSYEPVQRPSADLIEAVDTLLNEALCDCPDRMKHEHGEHLSGCHLFDLNEARLRMTKRTEPVQEPVLNEAEAIAAADRMFEHQQIGNHVPRCSRDEFRELAMAAISDYLRGAHPAPQPVELTDEEILMAISPKTGVLLEGDMRRRALSSARAVIAAYQKKQEGKV